MKCTILHDTAGRIRVHLEQPRMSLLQADILEAYLRNTPGVADVTVHDRTGNATILYTGQRAPIVAALAAFSYEKSAALAPEHSVRVLNREYEGKLIFRIVRRYTLKLILPAPLRAIRTVIRSLRFLRDGIRCLLHGKIEVPVLDATAIAVSILRGDFETAGSVIFLLGIGELLDEWTHKKSVADLAGTMALQVDKVWLETTDGSVAVPVGDVRPDHRPHRRHDPARRPCRRGGSDGESGIHHRRGAGRAPHGGQLRLCRDGRGRGRMHDPRR